VTYEFGIVKTNKGWYQYYQTVYYTHGLGLSWAANYAYISAKPGEHPTFSDWRGGFAGLGFGGTISGHLGMSTTYNTIGFGIGIGESYNESGKSTFFSIGQTTLLGQPYRADQGGSGNFTNSYNGAQTYLGGQ